MKMTDEQFAGITINISTLGQVDLSDNDLDTLAALAFLLEAALLNVRRAMRAQAGEEQGT
jgi:GAF domain-containing protein